MKTLEELMNLAYEFQCNAINGSARDEVSMPYFFAENDKGEMFVYAIANWTSETKNTIRKGLRQHFREHNIIQYATASEAWRATYPKDVDLSQIDRPSEHPSREDCLICGVVHRDGRKLGRSARIVVADDNKRHTDPLDEDPMESVGGFMLSLLE